MRMQTDMTARRRLPAGYRHLPTRATAASRRGVAAALDALLAPVAGPTGDAALALRQQMHCDGAAGDARQGELPLRGRP